MPPAGLAALLAEPFCLEFSRRSWNQSRSRSPRSARSCPVQVSAVRNRAKDSRRDRVKSSSPGGWAMFRGAGEGGEASSPPISHPLPLMSCSSPPSHSKSTQTPLPLPQTLRREKGQSPSVLLYVTRTPNPTGSNAFPCCDQLFLPNLQIPGPGHGHPP